MVVQSFCLFQVVTMFWYDFHQEMCIGYNVLALMAEINSFFLHSRKLMHMLHFDFANLFYRCVCMVNLVTFFFCRGWSLWMISYGMYTKSHLVPPIYFRFLCASIFVMNSINPVLFWRLFYNDVLRNLTKGKKSSVKLASMKPEMSGNNNTHIKSN